VTALTLVSLASLGILFSVRTKRSRDAILLAYLALLTYWAGSASLLWSFDHADILGRQLIRGAEPYTVEDLLGHANAGNPFIVAGWLLGFVHIGKSPMTPPYELVREYAIFHLMLSLLCCALAVLCVRQVALREARGTVQRRRLRGLGRPRIGNDP